MVVTTCTEAILHLEVKGWKLYNWT